MRNIISKTWGDFKEAFKISSEYDKKNSSVALRAAFCHQMKKTNFFTLEEIGSVMVFFKNNNVVYFDHTSVIHLINQSKIGYYKTIPIYNEAMKYLYDYIEENFQFKKIEEEDENKVSGAYFYKSKVEELEIEKYEVIKKLEEYEIKIKELKKCNISQIIRGVEKLNNVWGSLGYTTVDIKELRKVRNMINEM